MPIGHKKKFPCPKCGQPKSKKALTCMPCYRMGYGKEKDNGWIYLRLDKEALSRWRELVGKAKQERSFIKIGD